MLLTVYPGMNGFRVKSERGYCGRHVVRLGLVPGRYYSEEAGLAADKLAKTNVMSSKHK